MSQTLQVKPKVDDPHWYKNVKERDNYTCQHCGSQKRKDMRAHHIFYFGNYSELTNNGNLNNGITLCHKCHMIHHHWNNGAYSSHHYIRVNESTCHHYRNIERFWQEIDERRFKKLLKECLKEYIKSNEYLEFIKERDCDLCDWGNGYIKFEEWLENIDLNNIPHYLTHKFMYERYDSCEKCLRDSWNCRGNCGYAA